MKKLYALPVALTMGILISVGCYLNYLTYSAVGPFHDSMSYSNQLAYVYYSAASGGVLGFVKAAVFNTNVFLPYFTGVPLFWLFGANRLLFVFSNSLLCFVLLFTYSRYLSVVCQRIGFSQFPFLIVLFGFSSFYVFNGGVSDFRMDLPLAMLYASFVVQLQTARCKQSEKFDWIVLGGIAALACLNRATAPVFLLMFVCPIFIIDFLGGKKFLSKYFLAALVAAFFCGWYYLLNRDFLYFYYVIWNTDAHAHLPLAVSMTHLVFFREHLGDALLASLFLSFLVHAANFLYKKAGRFLDLFDFTFLWAASVPLAYLVLSGSGLNPYISLISVIPFILAFTVPNAKYGFVDSKINYAVLLFLFGVFYTVFISISGFATKMPNWVPSSYSVKSVADLIYTDAAGRDGTLTVTFPFQGSIGPDTLMNTSIYDFNLSVNGDRTIAFQKSNFLFKNIAPDSDILWRELPGNDDIEKVDNLIKVATASDYVVLATPGSNVPIMGHLKINRYIGRIYNYFLASPEFVNISGNVPISIDQSVVVLKRKEL